MKSNLRIYFTLIKIATLVVSTDLNQITSVCARFQGAKPRVSDFKKKLQNQSNHSESTKKTENATDQQIQYMMLQTKQMNVSDSSTHSLQAFIQISIRGTRRKRLTELDQKLVLPRVRMKFQNSTLTNKFMDELILKRYL